MLCKKLLQKGKTDTILSELIKKGGTVGKDFEGNLGKNYLRDCANQKLTQLLPLGQQKIVQKRKMNLNTLTAQLSISI